MSELEQTALNEEVIKPKKRRSKKEDANKITGKINTEAFNEAVSSIQKDSMVSQDAISDILEDSMRQAYLEWAYPGLFREKYCSESDELAKSLINCRIDFQDFNKFKIYDLKTITPEDQIVDDAYQISPEDYYSLTKKDADDGTIVELPVDVKLLDKSYVRRVKQLFTSKLKDASRQAILTAYKDQMNELIEGIVVKADNENGNYEFSFGKASAYIKKGSNKILPNDKFVQGEKVLCYLDKVSENVNPPSLDINRTSPKFVEKLMEREIPEVKEGIVVVKGIAREPGKRTKVFVDSTMKNVDPVGACIGPESSRQKNISNILKGEKIDFCKYNENKAVQIIEAMKPADIIGMTCLPDFFDANVHYEEFENERDYEHPDITVIVSNNNQGIAIGSGGSNVRLASRLTKCKLTVKQVDEAMKLGIKYMMVPDIKRELEALHPELVEEKPVENVNVEDADIDEEEINNEEIKPVNGSEEVKVETAPAAPAVEEVKPEAETVAPAIEEKPAEEVVEEKPVEEVEHVEIINKPKISLESIEAQLEQKKGPSETRSYRRKKKEDEKKEESTPSLASQTTAMPIYSEEELAAMDNQNAEDENPDDSYDDDSYDDYDSDEYYEDDGK